MEGFQIWSAGSTLYAISKESLGIQKKRRKPEPGDTEYYRRIYNNIRNKPACTQCKGKIMFNELNLLFCRECKQDYYLNPKTKTVHILKMEDVENDRLSSKEKRKDRLNKQKVI